MGAFAAPEEAAMGGFTAAATLPVSLSAGYGFRLSPQAQQVSWGEGRAVRMAWEASHSDQDADLGFGPFRLLPRSRTLLQDDRPVDLGSRGFDLLHVLLLCRGRIVSKQEIVRHVWPTTCVDESNLRFQMACLRRALGSFRDCIKTIPGRGYLLAAD